MEEKREIGDVPVVCERSGLILVIDAVVPGLDDLPGVIDLIEREGAGARFIGEPCPGCPHVLHEKDGPCRYRPLIGPLFVPRQATYPLVEGGEKP